MTDPWVTPEQQPSQPMSRKTRGVRIAVAALVVAAFGCGAVALVLAQPETQGLPQPTIDSVASPAPSGPYQKLSFRPVLVAGIPASFDKLLINAASADPAAPIDVDSQMAAGAAAVMTQVGLASPEVAAAYPNLGTEFLTRDCTQDTGSTSSSVSTADADPNLPLIACARSASSPSSGMKYLLGPAKLTDDDIWRATAGLREDTGVWLVSLEFSDEGARKFADTTTLLAQRPSEQQRAADASNALYSAQIISGSEALNQFAIVLGSRVLSAPTVGSPITDGKAEISGSFDKDSASALAEQINARR